MKPIAILNNGPIRRANLEFLNACGGDQDVLFASASGLPVSAFVDFDIEGGAELPEPDGFAAVILTGSPSMITGRHPWAEAEAAWLRRHRGRLPMLGVCFGHQMLTHALGGEVDWTPTGPEYGTVPITLTAAAEGDPLFGGLCRELTAMSAHSQNVARLPADAVSLAIGASGIQAARFDATIWGVQFHPEFDARAMRGLFSAYREHYTQLGLDIDALTDGLADTPLAAGIVRNFVALCPGADALAAGL